MIELAKKIVEEFEKEHTGIYTIQNISYNGLEFTLYLAAKAITEVKS